MESSRSGFRITVGTTDRSGNSEPAPGAIDKLWRVVSLPMMPVGLALWAAGIGLNAYWVIVGGTVTMALGAYKYTEPR